MAPADINFDVQTLTRFHRSTPEVFEADPFTRSIVQRASDGIASMHYRHER